MEREAEAWKLGLWGRILATERSLSVDLKGERMRGVVER